MIQSLPILQENCRFHKTKRPVAVCLDIACKSHKLSCPKCIVYFHADHPNSLIYINNLANSPTLESNLGLAKKITAKMSPETESFYTKAQELCDNLQLEIQKRLKTVKTNFRLKCVQDINSYYQKMSFYAGNFHKGFSDLGETQRTIKHFDNERISEEQFLMFVQKLIESRESVGTQENEARTGDIDEKSFGFKKWQVCQQLALLPKILVIPQKFRFYVGEKQYRFFYILFLFSAYFFIYTSIASKAVREVQQGKVFVFDKKYDLQVIYGPLLAEPLQFKVCIEIPEPGSEGPEVEQQQEALQTKKDAAQENNKNSLGNRMRLASSDSSDSSERTIERDIFPVNNGGGNGQPNDVNALRNQGLRHIFLGVVDDNNKGKERIYKYPAVQNTIKTFIQASDILQGPALGGQFRMRHSTRIEREGRREFIESCRRKIMNKEPLELHFSWDPKTKVVQYEDKQASLLMEANFNYSRAHNRMLDSRSLNAEGLTLRPFVCCNSSRVKITVEQKPRLKASEKKETST